LSSVFIYILFFPLNNFFLSLNRVSNGRKERRENGNVKGYLEMDIAHINCVTELKCWC
jgi:hypothetical protein